MPTTKTVVAGSDSTPRVFDCTAVSACWPPASVAVHDHAELVTVMAHTGVPPPVTVTVSPLTPEPLMVNVPATPVAPDAGAEMVGCGDEAAH